MFVCLFVYLYDKSLQACHGFSEPDPQKFSFVNKKTFDWDIEYGSYAKPARKRPQNTKRGMPRGRGDPPRAEAEGITNKITEGTAGRH